MTIVLQDLFYVLRGLSKRPVFTASVVMMLSVGIGANVSVFSIVNAMLLRPLPFGDRGDRIVTVHSTHRLQAESWGWGESPLSYRDLRDLRGASSFEGLAGYLQRSFTLAGEHQAERVQGASVTSDLFIVLGVNPMLGRHFLAEEAAAPGLESVAIITHGLWQRRYGGDPNIIGRDIIINERARTIVGVMPPHFRFPERDELYLPLHWDDALRSARNLNVVGALRSGSTRSQAQSELDSIAARLAEAYPETNRGFGVRVLRFRDSQIRADQRALSLALMGSVGFLLLIMCANLASLLLVRGVARQREMAIRAAMGASRGHLVSYVLCEAVVLAIGGTGLGLVLARGLVSAVPRFFPEELPYWMALEFDVRVASFVATIVMFTTLTTGMLPALRVARANMSYESRRGRGVTLGRAAQRIQSGLAIAQVGLCLALVVGASLLIRNFLALQASDLGFDYRSVLTARIYLPGDAYDDVRARAAFFARAGEVLTALPGISAAAATTSIPGDDAAGDVRIVVDGQSSSDADASASAIAVTAGLFEALGVRLVAGRDVTDAEASDPDGRVTIINQRLAKHLWGDESPLDRRVGVRGQTGVSWFRVVGVAPDIQYGESGEGAASSERNLYVPYAAGGSRSMALMIRTDRPPTSLLQPVRNALNEFHGGVPLYELMSMTERRRFITAEERFFGQLMAGFAAIALVLACVGVYALLAYAASRRRHEVGVRLALGAQPGDVVWLFVRQGSAIAIVGVLIGVVLALGVARALAGSLWGVDAFDPRLFGGVAATLVAVVLLASYWPAHRASRTDPMLALRVE